MLLITFANINVLGNLYSFGAMLSFTTAHAAIVALRIKDPDRERPYRMPGNVRIRGRQIPITAVIGGIGTFLAWVAVVALHPEAKYVGIPWMVFGMVGYVVYRKRSGLSLSKSVVLVRPERPPDFHELGYRTALVPIFGADVSAQTLVSAAKLIGKDGIVYAVFVLPVPRQLSLDAGLETEEALGRSILESARIQGRRAGIKVQHRPDPHAQPGRGARRRGAADRRRRDLPLDPARPGERAAHRPDRVLPARPPPLPDRDRDRQLARRPPARGRLNRRFPLSLTAGCMHPGGDWRMPVPQRAAPFPGSAHACAPNRVRRPPHGIGFGASGRSAGWESGCKWDIGADLC